MSDIKNIIVDELKNNNELRRIHLKDAITSLFTGEYRTGLLMLRDIVNATCGFAVLGEHLKKDPKSLMRMLSNGGNPTSENIFQIIHFLVQQEGGELDLKFVA